MRSLVYGVALTTIPLGTPLIAQDPTKLLAPQMGSDEATALLAHYPVSDVVHERSAAAVIKLTIAPNGKVIACSLIDQVGDARLANSVCGLSKRVRLKPARDRDGKAALGVITTIVKFTIPGTAQGEAVRQTQIEPDVIATLASGIGIPDGGIDVKVSLQIAPNATLDACEPRQPSIAALGKEACAIAARLKFDALSGPDGATVAYVTERRIRLIASGAGPATP